MDSGTLLKVCELVFRDDWGCLFNHRAVLGQSEERLEAKRPWGGYDSVLIMRSGTKKDGALAGWLSWSILPSARRLWVWFPLGHREEGCRGCPWHCRSRRYRSLGMEPTHLHPLVRLSQNKERVQVEEFLFGKCL